MISAGRFVKLLFELKTHLFFARLISPDSFSGTFLKGYTAFCDNHFSKTGFNDFKFCLLKIAFGKITKCL